MIFSDVKLIEKGNSNPKESGLVGSRPLHVVLNGTEVAVSGDDPIVLSEIDGENFIGVRLTLLVSRLSIEGSA